MNSPDMIGRTLGQYRIEKALEVGGMGQVFRGIHMYLDRPAAIKIMSPHLAARANFRERFLQEAKSAAALKHPNIVSIYEFGEQGDVLYLVMELMTGGSLRSLLQRRSGGQSWPLMLVLDLMSQAAEGLAAAHAMNVIHRDIKPDNLLLNQQGTPPVRPGSERYELKISDFGLARLTEGSGLTATDMPMGTLAYMSPEQCIGGKVDGRSDLYSLGVVLYEVATGYLPFQIENFGQALDKHSNAAPPPPRQIQSALPQALEDLILRSLAKRPEDRFQNGAEFAQALRGVMGLQEVETMVPMQLPQRSVSSQTSQQTALQPSVAHVPPTPIVPTLPGGAGQPQVRVVDQNGKTLQVATITARGLIVGRQSGNDIVLPTEKVSRQHLQIQWNSTQVTVKDLGSSNGTVLGGSRIAPQIGIPWNEQDLIRLDTYWLRLEGVQELTATQMAQQGVTPTLVTPGGYAPGAATTQRTQLMTSVGGSERIGISIEPKLLAITPGQSAMVRVLLTNLGSTVDWFTVRVEGVPREWVQGAGQVVQLNPGMQEAVDLSVQVNRIPTNLAQEYPVIIRAESREQPAESGLARARWNVLPFREDALRIEPRRVSGVGNAAYTVTLYNGGNTPADYELSGEDDERKLIYRFGQNRLRVEPGREARIGLRVESNARLLGGEQRQPFQVHTRVAGHSIPLMGVAELVNKARLPGWLLPVALATVLIGGGIADAALGGPPFGRSVSSTPTPLATLTPIVTPTPKPVPTATLIPTVQPTSAPPVVVPTPAPTPTPTPTPTPMPTPTPTPDLTATAVQTIQDRYNNITNGSPTLDDAMNGSEWPSGQNSNGSCGYSSSDGAYHASSAAQGYYWNCFRNGGGGGGKNFSNFVYQMQMRIVAGSTGGITFRATSNGYYLFDVGQDGSYYVTNPAGTTLTNGQSSYMNTTAGVTNTIAVMVNGSEIDLFINNQFVGTTQDSTNTNGIIGVIGTYAQSSAGDIAYASARVWTIG